MTFYHGLTYLVQNEGIRFGTRKSDVNLAVYRNHIL